ncbi:uncharacterized protein LOC117316704 isoform X2 [Pecten maximus]|uniref:uncharacterized protein LOC117316704 isoform X2 n=1 Tax=Pecten maximus TaxID=6579 RepID=UPI0014587AFC|nr:uncharacterized protein LOC117316704 isoform X2 [Pecten maximus]
MATDVSDVTARQETMATDISDVTARQETMATDISDVTSRQEPMATDVSDVTSRQEPMATDVSDVTSRQEPMAGQRQETMTASQESMANDLQIIPVVNTGEISHVLRNSTSVHVTIKPKNLVLGEGGRIINNGAKQETMAAVQDTMEAVQDTMEAVQENMETIQYMAGRQETFSTMQESMTTDISNVTTRQESMATDISNVTTRQESMATDISNVTTRQESMATDISNVTTRQESMATDISNVTTRQESMATDISNVTTRQESMSDRQKKMTNDLHSLQGTVDAVSDDVDAVKKDVSDIKQTSAKNGGRDPKLTAMIDTTKSTIQTEKKSYKFISTKSLQDSHQKLLENKIVIIQGNSGDGKSSAALELLRLLCGNEEEGQQKRCRQPLQLHDIKDLDLVAPKSQLVIYFDDICGKNVVCQEDVKEWEKREKEILAKLCGNESEANYLVITIRSGIFNSINGLGKSFTKNIVDLSQYKEEKEKLALLRLYEPKTEFVKWTDDEEKQIVASAPDIGFPQCCRLFRDTPSLQTERVKFFERPLHYFKSSLSKLEDGKFYGLLYLFLNGGSVVEHDLDPSIENIEENEKMKAAFAFDVVKVNLTPELIHKKEKKKAEFVKEVIKMPFRLAGEKRFYKKKNNWKILSLFQIQPRLH